MPIQTLTWVPPSLCDCKLRITADWTESPPGGVSYRHPIPFTVQAVQIVSVCLNHVLASKSMPDTSRFFDVPEPGSVAHFLGSKTLVGDPIPVQHRGYLRYPIANPTEAECLYTFLSMHRGQTHSLPCGCASHQHFDEMNHTDNPSATGIYKQHPVHSKQCAYHQGDTIDMTQARTDHEAYVALQNETSKPSQSSLETASQIDQPTLDALKLAVTTIRNAYSPGAPIDWDALDRVVDAQRKSTEQS